MIDIDRGIPDRDRETGSTRRHKMPSRNSVSFSSLKWTNGVELEDDLLGLERNQSSSSVRRSALSESHIEAETDLLAELLELERSDSRMEWLRSLKELDPRHQILT